MINTLLSPLIKAFLHTEYCYCQYYSIDITLDILGYTLDILGLDILGLDILGLDILGLDILGLDILGYTRASRGDPYILLMADPTVDMDTSRGMITSPALPSISFPNV